MATPASKQNAGPETAQSQVYHLSMTRVAPMVPAQSDLLCEFCGYTLNGLPEYSNCPECGRAIEASLRSQRRPPAWEPARGWQKFPSFLDTTAAVIFRPTEFFRTTTARGDFAAARWFGIIHWIIASILLGITGSVH